MPLQHAPVNNLSPAVRCTLTMVRSVPCAADNDVSYLIDSQAYYVKHINGEAGSQKLVYDWDNMYWALNVFLAQVVDDGPHFAKP